MKTLISARGAGKVLICLLILLAVFHVLILLRVIPYGIVWGGTINDFTSLITLETVSLLLTVAFIWIISLQIGIVQTEKFKKTIGVSTWIMFGYFVLNTVGNLASGVSAEKWIFTPLTVLMTLLAFRVAMEKD